MSLLRRYVLIEFLKVFLVVLSTVVFVFILSEVVKELIRKGFTPGQVTLLLPFVLPHALRVAIQAAILFAACSVFGRMSSDNEFLAAKAGGISPISLLMPVFVLTIPLSFFAVWLDEIDGTWGCEGVQRQLVEHFDEIAVEFLKRQNYFETNQFQLAVRAVRDRELILPAVKIQRPNEQVTILAQVGEIRRGSGDEGFRLTLRGGTVMSTEYHYSFTDAMELEISPPCELQEAYTWERYTRQRDVVDRLEREVAVERREAERANRPMNPDLLGELESQQKQARRFKSQLYNKWTNGFCCLCFALIGAPAAMLLRFGHWLATFFTCFMPIVLFYHPLQSVPINMSESGYIPSECVFLTNVVLCGIGIALCWRVHSK